MRRVVALTIAGSDSGGNAGIQADLRAFHVFGVHGCTVLAALTAQNPFGVRGILTADADFIGMQLDAVLEAYAVSALKTGMLATPDVITAVADRLLGEMAEPFRVGDREIFAAVSAGTAVEPMMEPMPRKMASVTNVVADHTSGGGWNIAMNASRAVPANDASTTYFGAKRSASAPPTASIKAGSTW